MKQAELDKAKENLDDLTSKKKKSKAGAKITQEQRDKADFFYKIQDADKEYRAISGKAWNASSQRAKLSGYKYTYGSGAHNRPLRGFDNQWGDANFKGVGKVPLDNEGRDYVLDLADMIDKAPIPNDKWFARGLGDYNNEAIVAYFGEDRQFLLYADEKAVKQRLIGKRVVDEGYQSHGVIKSAGWSGHKFETFAPKGTKAMYVEPFSYYAGHSYDELKWDGVAKQTASQFGESEILFQAMTEYEIVDVDIVGTGTSRRFAVKQQVVGQKSAEEIRKIWVDRMKKIGVTI
jgi:hypothetical protein